MTVDLLNRASVTLASIMSYRSVPCCLTCLLALTMSLSTALNTASPWLLLTVSRSSLSMYIPLGGFLGIFPPGWCLFPWLSFLTGPTCCLITPVRLQYRKVWMKRLVSMHTTLPLSHFPRIWGILTTQVSKLLSYYKCSSTEKPMTTSATQRNFGLTLAFQVTRLTVNSILHCKYYMKLLMYDFFWVFGW